MPGYEIKFEKKWDVYDKKDWEFCKGYNKQKVKLEKRKLKCKTENFAFGSISFVFVAEVVVVGKGRLFISVWALYAIQYANI